MNGKSECLIGTDAGSKKVYLQIGEKVELVGEYADNIGAIAGKAKEITDKYDFNGKPSALVNAGYPHNLPEERFAGIKKALEAKGLNPLRDD